MIFRQLFDAASSTYTYLLADAATRQAVVIDPVFEQHARDTALLRELGLELVLSLDTHCHADHVTGAWLLRQSLGSAIGMAAAVGAENVDRPLADGDEVVLGGLILDVLATPGHTDGCLSFVTRERTHVFTGDALLIRGAGRTDFQGGDARRLYRSIRERLFTLPDACLVYPGHDYEGRTVSSIGEEEAWNARIGGGAREEDFVGYMTNLGLPHPRQLALAVPANLRAGKPEGGAPQAAPPWGPVVRTFAGVPEIAPEWVCQHRAEVQLVDVRSAAELAGELGHIEGVRGIPLEELRARVGEIGDDRPVIVICQTGRRAALAAAILSQAGRARVASLAGGMVAWRELGLP